ncbi:MAG TPA: hypothetical protein VLH84_00125 [Patescibacteria group bacterium]|nr:hypothetical protein [Patescibacteria group bacterium]
MTRSVVFPGENELRLDIPGGRYKPGIDQDLVGALDREVIEETGREIVTRGLAAPFVIARQVIQRPEPNPNVVRLTCVASAPAGRIITSSEHQGGVDYLTPAEALNRNVDPYLRTVLENPWPFRWYDDTDPFSYLTPGRAMLSDVDVSLGNLAALGFPE